MQSSIMDKTTADTLHLTNLKQNPQTAKSKNENFSVEVVVGLFGVHYF